MSDLVNVTSQENVHALYTFGQVIGYGKYGIVREATLIKNPNKRVAIKTIERPKAVEELLQLKAEIEILRSVDHPNVVKVYETYLDEQSLYLVMEYCIGGELFDHIMEGGKFSEQGAARIVTQVLGALKYLH